MIRINASQIIAEAQKEVAKLDRDSADFVREVLVKGIEIAESITPRDHGDLVAAWGANIGDKPDLKNPGGGANAARAALAKFKIGDRVWITNTNYKATWHDKGTMDATLGPHIRGRRMADRATQWINSQVSK